jgi:hypothetical protein
MAKTFCLIPKSSSKVTIKSLIEIFKATPLKTNEISGSPLKSKSVSQ